MHTLLALALFTAPLDNLMADVLGIPADSVVVDEVSHPNPVRAPAPAVRYIDGERVDVDHDEDDHEDDDGFEHSTDECEAW